MPTRAPRALVSLCLAIVGCSASTADGPGAAPSGPAAEPAQAGTALGKGDGSAQSVDFVVVHEAGAASKLVDLAWNPAVPGQWWVLGYDSSVYIGQGLDGDAPTWMKKKDPASVHFMYRPTAIAMGDNGFWGTCGNNDNSQAARTPNMFMGPALFTTNLDVFAVYTPNGLGSHYDMLHGSPFCRGIAHVAGNEYWAFNANDGALDHYKFNKDHGPGNDDHSDGEIYRYAVGQVKGDADGETSSHLFFDASDGLLYVADTGNKRIVRLDPTKGKPTGELPRQNEPLKGQGIAEGTTVEEVVPPGVLEKPSGLEVKDDVIYVTDRATSTFHAFDKTGKEVRSLATDLPAGALGGFVFGPDGKIWFTDRVNGRVLRIEPR
jgi:hypothetical protein